MEETNVVGIKKENTSIYAEKITSRKQPALYVWREYPEEVDGEPAIRVKMDRVAFFKDEEKVKIFEDALQRMFNDGSARIITKSGEIFDHHSEEDEE